MENARNTFYLALRDQLMFVNPLRVMVLRGVQRPGILVEENESAVAVNIPDIFVLRWSALSIDTEHVLPLAQQVCEISYWSEGTSTNGGLDRGRLLSAMDAELMQMVAGQDIAKQNFATQPPVQMATRIFWSAATFESVLTTKNRLSRMAKVTLYSYEEAADL